jgi:mRNA interferase RelE/StbE
VSYSLIVLPSAEKQILRLNSPDYDSVRARIAALKDNPRPVGSRKLHDVPGWRIRVGRYRIVYEIDDSQKVVTVLKVAHRKDIYR